MTVPWVISCNLHIYRSGVQLLPAYVQVGQDRAKTVRCHQVLDATRATTGHIPPGPRLRADPGVPWEVMLSAVTCRLPCTTRSAPASRYFCLYVGVLTVELCLHASIYLSIYPSLHPSMRPCTLNAFDTIAFLLLACYTAAVCSCFNICHPSTQLQSKFMHLRMYHSSSLLNPRCLSALPANTGHHCHN